MGKEKKDDKSQLLAIVFLLLAGFFVYLFLQPESKPQAKVPAKDPYSAQFQDKVNRHLFSTSQHIEMNREKMKVEADRLALQGIGPKVLATPDAHGVDFSADPRADALLKALGRDVKEPSGSLNPDDQVQADLFESQQLQEYSEEYKKEYARQFVENARRAGYLIKLNDDYKVISVRPIRKPADNFELFQSSGPAVR